jgi:hypothetical protein
MDDTPGATLGRLIVGFQVSEAIHVAATLGVADLLAEGPRTSDELAAATSAHAGSLYRLLRALASVGVFHEDEGRRFSMTPMGALLRSDVPGSLRGWAVYVGRPYFREAWRHLEHSIRTGDNAFQHVHGTDVWAYRAEHPDESAIFDLAMESLTGASNPALLDAYDFGRFGTVVDVGGGNGALLAALLGEFPATRGVLFDQPHVVAKAAAVLERAGVADRCEIVSGSFFDEVPPGGDAYTLKSTSTTTTTSGPSRSSESADAQWLEPRRCFSSSGSSAHPTRMPEPSSPTSTCSSHPQGGSGRFTSGTSC